MKCIHLCLQFAVLYLVIGVALCSPLNNTTDEDCHSDNDCPLNLICAGHTCVDPCLGACSLNTDCIVENHLPVCSCKPGYEGDPFSECKSEVNECTHNEQCSEDKACINHSCVSPCEGACGVNTVCRVVNHHPLCHCLRGFFYLQNVGCTPSLVPDCQADSHCSDDQVCLRQKCVDPCEDGICGNNTVCRVKNHYLVCTCKVGFYGDALEGCMPYCSSKQIDNKEAEKTSNKTFFISDFKTDWFEAFYYCSSRDMNLATVNNEDEWNDLVSTYQSKNYPELEMWLGGHDLGRYKQFMWVSTAKRLSYTNWRNGEPQGEQYHCLKLGGNFEWISHDCSNKYYFACESTK